MRHKQQENSHKLRKIFDEVYLAESDALFRFCLVRVSDREQAVDLVQEIFTRFWQNINSGTIEYPRAFLFKVARNAIIDWYRKKKSISLESMADLETQEPYEQIHDSAILDSRLDGEGRFLISKIRDLGSGYRDAIYLRYVEGLSPPEIAEILGISTNAASVRINRGIEELRKLTGYDIEIEDSK
ncbi:MAG: RNA polymerase sigma factor [Patescibacteria group bacterium]